MSKKNHKHHLTSTQKHFGKRNVYILIGMIVVSLVVAIIKINM